MEHASACAPCYAWSSLTIYVVDLGWLRREDDDFGRVHHGYRTRALYFCIYILYNIASVMELFTFALSCVEYPPESVRV